MRALIGIGASAVLVLTSLSWAFTQDKSKVSEKVPQIAREAAEAKFPKGKIESVEGPEYEDGQMTFKFMLKMPGEGDIELRVTPTGKIVGVEQDVTLESLPPAITKGIEAIFPGKKVSELKRVELAFKGYILVVYEVVGETAQGKKEVFLNPTGKVATVEEGGEEVVPVDKLPKEISKAVEGKFSGATIKSAVKKLKKE